MSGRPIDARVALARQRREQARRERAQRRAQRVAERRRHHEELEQRATTLNAAGVESATGTTTAGLGSRSGRLRDRGQREARRRGRAERTAETRETLLARAEVLAQESEALRSAGFDSTGRQAADRARQLVDELHQPSPTTSLHQLAQRLDRVEKDIERAADHQELQTEVQAAFVTALGSDAALVVDAAASRGGRIRLATDAGHIDVDVAEAGDAEMVDLRFHVEEAGLDRVATRNGTLESCDAEEHVVEALVNRVAAVAPKPARETAGLWQGVRTAARAARANVNGRRR
jgi:hypothetical protein